MAVALLLGCLIVCRCLAIDNEERRARLAAYIATSTLLHLLAFMVLTIELDRMPELLGTTGSDSLRYFETAREVAAGARPAEEALNDFAGGYAVFCAAVLATSPSGSPVFIVLCNILLFQIVLIELETLMRRSRFGDRAISVSLLLVALNGSLMWTSIRILKDVLFYALFLSVLRASLELPRRLPLNVAVIAGACAWMAYVRPRSYLLVLAVSAFSRIVWARPRDILRLDQERSRRGVRIGRKLIVASAAATMLGGWVAWRYGSVIASEATNFLQAAAIQASQDVETWDSRSVQLYERDPIEQIAVGVVRFFVLPIPISVLLQRSDLGTYTLLVSVGSLLGLLTLGYSARAIVNLGGTLRRGYGLPVALLVMAAGMSLTYIVLFSGNAEARHRLPLYIALAVTAGRRLGEGHVSAREHAAVLGAVLLLNVGYVATL